MQEIANNSINYALRFLISFSMMCQYIHFKN